jgi:hypothetical protein
VVGTSDSSVFTVGGARFLHSVRTVGGKRDSMFGFGFNQADEVVQTRGDSARRYRDFSQYVLSGRVGNLRNFLRHQRQKLRPRPE